MENNHISQVPDVSSVPDNLLPLPGGRSAIPQQPPYSIWISATWDKIVGCSPGSKKRWLPWILIKKRLHTFVRTA